MKIEIIPCLNYSYSKQTNTISIVDPATFSDCDKVVGKCHIKHTSSCSVLKRAYEGDKNRIPGIDILLRDNEIKKIGNLEVQNYFDTTSGLNTFTMRI